VGTGGELLTTAHKPSFEKRQQATSSARTARHKGAETELTNATPHALLEGEPHAHFHVASTSGQSPPVEIERDALSRQLLLSGPLVVVLERLIGLLLKTVTILLDELLLLVLVLVLVLGMGKESSTGQLLLLRALGLEKGEQLHDDAAQQRMRLGPKRNACQTRASTLSASV
jgi:hypothetical protein